MTQAAAQPSSAGAPRSQVTRRLAAAAATVLIAGTGAAFVIVGISRSSAASDQVRSTAAAAASYSALTTATGKFRTNAKACKSASQPLPCITNVDRRVAQAYRAFGRQIQIQTWATRRITNAASELAAAASQTAQSFTALEKAPSVAQYGILVDNSSVVEDSMQVDQDYGYLRFLLETS